MTEVQQIKKVLIVEDSDNIAKAIKILLETDEINSDIINDSKKAMTTLTKKSYSLVILDLMMPEISGVELLREIKKSEKLSDLKTLILTAKADALKWDKEIKNCDKFMTKPFENKKLLKEVKKLLK